MKLYRLYVVDLDGTVYRGSEVIAGAAEAISELRHRGAVIRFVTNNSSQTREHYSAKLRALGIEAEPEEIYSSAVATASYLKSEGLRTAFAVGEQGLIDELSREGIRVENLANDMAEGLGSAEVVVAGICRGVTYVWLSAAMQQILRGARFIATNADATYPMENGRLEPGAGSIVAAIAACSGVQAFVVGKPNAYVIQMALEETGIDKSDTLVVGDRLNTDIEAGMRAGCDTHLVLTGVEKEAPPGQSWSIDLRALIE